MKSAATYLAAELRKLGIEVDEELLRRRMLWWYDVGPAWLERERWRRGLPARVLDA